MKKMLLLIGISLYLTACTPKTETEIPTTDFAEVYIGVDDYPHFVLKDYGNVDDNPENTSYEEICSRINGNEMGTETFIICDIINYCYNADLNGNTDLYCEMPNGELHVFTITDAPESKCHLVTFRTTNMEDYGSYEVVAVR